MPEHQDLGVAVVVYPAAAAAGLMLRLPARVRATDRSRHPPQHGHLVTVASGVTTFSRRSLAPIGLSALLASVYGRVSAR